MLGPVLCLISLELRYSVSRRATNFHLHPGHFGHHAQRSWVLFKSSHAVILLKPEIHVLATVRTVAEVSTFKAGGLSLFLGAKPLAVLVQLNGGLRLHTVPYRTPLLSSSNTPPALGGAGGSSSPTAYQAWAQGSALPPQTQTHRGGCEWGPLPARSWGRPGITEDPILGSCRAPLAGQHGCSLGLFFHLYPRSFRLTFHGQGIKNNKKTKNSLCSFSHPNALSLIPPP